MRYRAVFFDLDGTITDSAPGILGSMQYALGQFGIQADREELRKYVGPPLRQMFADYLPEDRVDEGVRTYRHYYNGGKLFDATIYEGIPQTLARLHKAGLKVCLATAKPKKTAEKFLAHFELDRQFDLIGGTQEDAGIADKTAVICKNREELGFLPQECLMVGDRQDDLLGAAAAGVDAIGVLYGYGCREELLACPHLALVETPAAVAEFVLRAD